ncbi:MAG: putative F420-dependent oxidoreductase [Candidatus Azotimanducaceae bacterium]|jgi:probable F420-dependent oxidoreductase
MKIGVTLRNMGPQSTREIMARCCQRAEEIGFDSIWITDHIAIPPDDSQGSGGRYTDPLTTLAWLAGMTQSIYLGVGVLIAPYRSALPTAKQIATVQELSNNRLLLGIAVGWMDAEFKALGVDRHQRGKITDETLTVIKQCFENDIVKLNDQAFIFSPRPMAPPIYIGGSVKHAPKRAVKFGHGWLPMTRNPETLARDLETFHQLGSDQGVEPGPVAAMTSLPLDNIDEAKRLANDYQELGIERLICSVKYTNADEYSAQLEQLAKVALTP